MINWLGWLTWGCFSVGVVVLLVTGPDEAVAREIVHETESGNIDAAKQIADGRWTIPTTIDEEKAANPFLRADVPAVAAAVGLAGRPAQERGKLLSV